mmetsp:Transcript_19222/g.34772  ORF Transcript_19222/g.34772 Transcript_19222/m.34772 type:complete len:164 (-) Transcript_19222:874-1365(-)
MPRGRSAPRSASRSSSSASSRSRPAASSRPTPQAPGYQYSRTPPPAHSASAPPPAPMYSQGGGMLSGLGSSLMMGASLGTGSAIAHRAVDAMMGPRTVVHQNEEGYSPQTQSAPASSSGLDLTPENACSVQVKAFADCMSRSNADMTACQLYFDAMQQCKLRV